MDSVGTIFRTHRVVTFGPEIEIEDDVYGVIERAFAL